MKRKIFIKPLLTVCRIIYFISLFVECVERPGGVESPNDNPGKQRGVRQKNTPKMDFCRKLAHGVLNIISNKSNSTAVAVQVEANLQEQLNDHLHFLKPECC